MYIPPEVLIDLARARLDDLYREAERERRAAAVQRAQPGRPLRARVADGLYALAARVEGGQPRRVAREGAPLAA